MLWMLTKYKQPKQESLKNKRIYISANVTPTQINNWKKLKGELRSNGGNIGIKYILGIPLSKMCQKVTEINYRSSQAYTSINLYYQNVRRLNAKVTGFYSQVSEAEYNLIAISETWLNDSVSSSEMFPGE